MGRENFHDACRKLESGIDDNLKSYYVTTAAISEIAGFDSSRAIVVGLKGIGKTAAFRYFTEFENTPDVVIGINSDRFSLHLPNNNLHFATCRKQFQHDLVMEALRAVNQQRAKLKGKVSAQLLDKAERQFNSYTDMLRRFSARVQGFGVSIVGCGFTLPIGTTGVQVAVGLQKEADLEKPLKLLKDICACGVRIRLVIDDPEQVFSASRELDTHLVGGFCLAALRLAALVPGLKIIALLKTHIYYPILREVDDLRNHPDHMGRLSWSKKELVELISDRLRWSKSNWTEIFAGSEVEARRLVNSMCESVRNGPRDLLRGVDLALQNAKAGKIDARVVGSCKKNMSLSSLGELESAHSAHYPRIRAVIKAIFGKSSDHKFTLSELKQHIGNLLIRDTEMIALSRMPWMQMETSETLPELLFEAGALALGAGDRLMLPYEEHYDNEHFEEADHLILVPALVGAIERR
jgi:hypothetical protein